LNKKKYLRSQVKESAAVQKNFKNYELITPTANISAPTHGGRAKCLQRLVRLDLPVPKTVALSFNAIKEIVSGKMPDLIDILSNFVEKDTLCVRPSSESVDWGGPGAVLNIGMNDERCSHLSKYIGKKAAAELYFRFIQAYSVNVARLDPDVFDHMTDANGNSVSAALTAYKDEMDENFPQSIEHQLSEVLRSMARAWEGTSARLLREAKGAPADAGLGLVIQKMAFGVGDGESGSGVLQLVNSDTGQSQITGRYLRQSQGRESLSEKQGTLFLTLDTRGPSLETEEPKIFRDLINKAELMRKKLREEMEIEFTIENGRLHILDGIRVVRRPRAAVLIAVSLAKDKIITKEEALMRVDPRAVGELLHRQIDPNAERDILAKGVAASPGAATGIVVFSASEAQACAARGETCILVRRETSPEDIRGMHAAAGVLTERGGVTSHAAVIGRGIGLPCVVGVSEINFDSNNKAFSISDGRSFNAGDSITIDGTLGHVLGGTPKMIEAALDDSLKLMLDWAEDAGDIKVRANADTPSETKTAQNFNAHGIGLCRTEHMFFEADRLTLMREMIFAHNRDERRAVLDRLLPMQRSDFFELFNLMQGLPVCIRLFDLPLHEFLPNDREGMHALAEALDLPLSHVVSRVETLAEYNPMLGMRGVRVGVTVPEIYEMQARAIFEATAEASKNGTHIVPEIMIPLVSAKREVELVRARIDGVASMVRAETAIEFDYRLGVMVETPRAALRADDIALNSAFLSFGTNDLTQMTYGLSRDDAGRFMSDYVQQGVFPEDPFHTLDIDGVGELLKMGVTRARGVKSDIVLSICGEHGGSPESIDFCRKIGMDYVSCSPFRVPVAKLAAAQLAIKDRIEPLR
jgi:pyruvate,orthophosphate dikinase